MDHGRLKIFKIDPETGKVVDSVPLADGRHMGIALVGDHIWLVDGLRRLFRKVEPATGEIVKEVRVVTPYPVSLTSWEDDLYFADSGRLKIYRIQIKEDEPVKVVVLRSAYSVDKDIEFEVTFREWVVWGAHCSRWFEKKTDQGWQEIGECHPPNYDALPWPVGDDETIRFAMPTISPDHSFYVYTL